jgi:hypothetical protein
MPDWNPTPKPDQQASKPPSPRNVPRNVVSNIITVFLAIVIISVGFISPNLLYPVLDPYHDEAVILTDGGETSIEMHVFDEPVSLYPWSLYNEDAVRPITPGERDMLISHNVPEFLIQMAGGFGLSTEGQDTATIQNYIASSFVYLNTSNGSENGCYLLPELDINNDGSADIRCAVDMDGAIISLASLHTSWVSLEQDVTFEIWDFVNALTATSYTYSQYKVETAAAILDNGFAERYGHAFKRPGSSKTELGEKNASNAVTDSTVTDDTNPIDPESAESNSEQEAGTNIPEQNSQIDDNQNNEDLGSASEATTGSIQPQANINGIEPTQESGESGSGGDGSSDTGNSGNTGSSDTGASGNTATNGSGNTATGSTGTLSENSSPSDGAVPFSLTPIVFASEQYLYYIYDLADGIRFILYLDPDTTHCMGFNLQV